MIERAFEDLIISIRNFVNSTRRNNNFSQTYIIDILQNEKERFDFFTNNDSSTNELEYRLIKEMYTLSKWIFKKSNNKDNYLTNLQRNIEYLTWINLKHKINKNKRKYTVAQREIFYANCGNNVGREQNGRRPVIILQNNLGNKNNDITFVAPVTTHQNKIEYDSNREKYYITREKDGHIYRKYLDFYEIPLKLEGHGNSIYGFVNIIHARSIDKKRICSRCQGIASKECFTEIIYAINKNLSLDE